MTKTYSTRFNARRAAEKAGLTGYRLEPRGGGFAIALEHPESQPAAEPSTPDHGMAVEKAMAAFLAMDDRSGAAMRALFAEVFQAGQQFGASSRKPRVARATRRGCPSKREIAAGLLTRPEGTTTREILDATGWPAVSVPAIAKASGLTLKHQKDGRVTRYFAVADLT